MEWLAIAIPLVSLVAVFTFVAIAAWSDNRRKGRQTLHRHETYRRMLEQPRGSARDVPELMRREESQRQQRKVEGIRPGGMITATVGVSLMVFLYFLFRESPVFPVGVIPLLIGLVLVI